MAFWGKKDGDEESTKQEFSITSEGSSHSENQSTSDSKTCSEISDAEKYGKIRSALGPGTVIQGKLSFDTVVSIDGKLSGEIYSSKTLLVGNSGQIDAIIDVASLVVKGTVKGTVKAAQRIEVCAGGQLTGDIECPVFVLEEGGLFNGNCTMKKAVAESKAAVQKNSTVKGIEVSSAGGSSSEGSNSRVGSDATSKTAVKSSQPAAH